MIEWGSPGGVGSKIEASILFQVEVKLKVHSTASDREDELSFPVKLRKFVGKEDIDAKKMLLG